MIEREIKLQFENAGEARTAILAAGAAPSSAGDSRKMRSSIPAMNPFAVADAHCECAVNQAGAC